MIEGRISVLMRGRGMKRCRAEGAERFALFVGAAVLANNLMIIGKGCRSAAGGQAGFLAGLTLRASPNGPAVVNGAEAASARAGFHPCRAL